MESVLNNLLLLVENNCNEGTYVKASAMIKKAYELQNNNDSDSDSDSEGGGSIMRISTTSYCLLKQSNIDLKNEVRELEGVNENLEKKVGDLKKKVGDLKGVNESLKNKAGHLERKIDLERKDNNENRIELLEEIRELNKKIRELDW